MAKKKIIFDLTPIANQIDKHYQGWVKPTPTNNTTKKNPIIGNNPMNQFQGSDPLDADTHLQNPQWTDEQKDSVYNSGKIQVQEPDILSKAQELNKPIRIQDTVASSNTTSVARPDKQFEKPRNEEETINTLKLLAGLGNLQKQPGAIGKVVKEQKANELINQGKNVFEANKMVDSIPFDTDTTKADGSYNKFFQENKAGRLLGSLASGVGAVEGGLSDAIGGIAETLGWDNNVFSQFGDMAQKTIKELSPQNPTDAENIVMGLGSTIPLLPLGVLGGVAGKAMGMSNKIAAIFGVTVPTVAESLAESGGVYRESKDPIAAGKNFLANMLVTGITNYYGIFAPEAKATLKSALLNIPMEGLQEASQSVLQSTSQGKQPNWEQVIQEGMIGGAIGGLFGGAGVISEQFNKAKEQKQNELNIDAIARMVSLPNQKVNPSIQDVLSRAQSKINKQVATDKFTNQLQNRQGNQNNIQINPESQNIEQVLPRIEEGIFSNPNQQRDGQRNILPNAEQQTSDLPTLEEVYSPKQNLPIQTAEQIRQNQTPGEQEDIKVDREELYNLLLQGNNGEVAAQKLAIGLSNDEAKYLLSGGRQGVEVSQQRIDDILIPKTLQGQVQPKVTTETVAPKGIDELKSVVNELPKSNKVQNEENTGTDLFNNSADVQVNAQNIEKNEQTILGDKYDHVVKVLTNNPDLDASGIMTAIGKRGQTIKQAIEDVRSKVKTAIPPTQIEDVKPIEDKEVNTQEEGQIVPKFATESENAGRTATPISKRVSVEHGGHNSALRVTGENENTLEIEGYGTVPTGQFIRTLVKGGRLPEAALKNTHIQLTKEYATKLLNENADLFPPDLQKDLNNQQPKGATNEQVQTKTTEEIEKPSKKPLDIDLKDIPETARGYKQVNKYSKQLSESGTPEEVLNNIQSIENNLTQMDNDYGVKSQTEKIKDDLKGLGYEIVDLKGRKYNEGMIVRADFVPDDNLDEGEYIIDKIKRPQINKNGVMVQSAQIIVRQGMKPRSSTDIKLNEAKPAEIEAPSNSSQIKEMNQSLGKPKETALESKQPYEIRKNDWDRLGLKEKQSLLRELGHPALDAGLLAADIQQGIVNKALNLRKQADTLSKESMAMLNGIPPGQPIHSTRDRNLRERASEKMGKANQLYRQADEWEAKNGKAKPFKAHEFLIEQALKDGKTVPDNVLADYPTLAAKYKPQPEGTDAAPQMSELDNKKQTVSRIEGLIADRDNLLKKEEQQGYLSNKDSADLQYLDRTIKTEEQKQQTSSSVSNSAQPRVQDGVQVIQEIVFPLEAAESGFRHMSMNPRGRAKGEQSDYEKNVKELEDILNNEATGDKKHLIPEAIQKFKKDYIEQRKKVYRVASGVVSSMVAGGSKFNYKQANRRGDAYDRAEANFRDWYAKETKNIETELGVKETRRIKAEQLAERKAITKQSVNEKLVERWTKLKAGDKVDIGANEPVEILKKNKFSIETANGVKWTLKEIYGIDHKLAQEVLDKLDNKQEQQNSEPNNLTQNADKINGPRSKNVGQNKPRSNQPKTWQEAVIQFVQTGGKFNTKSMSVKEGKEYGISFRNFINNGGQSLETMIDDLGFTSKEDFNSSDYQQDRMIRDLLAKYNSPEKRKAFLESQKDSNLDEELPDNVMNDLRETEALDEIILNEYLDTDGNLRLSDIVRDTEDITKRANVTTDRLNQYLAEKENQKEADNNLLSFEFTDDPFTDIDNAINEGVINDTQAESITGNAGGIEESETTIEGIESQANSASEELRNETIEEANKLVLTEPTVKPTKKKAKQEEMFSGEDNRPVFSEPTSARGKGIGEEGSPLFSQEKEDKGQGDIFKSEEPKIEEPLFKYEEYSDWSRMLAKNNTPEELQKQLGKAEAVKDKNAASHLSAINKTTSMQSNSQRRAQTGNVVRAGYEERNALENALEIYKFYPEKTKLGAEIRENKAKNAPKDKPQALFQKIKSDIPETITVNGTERPTRDNQGNLIHPTLKGIENFWKNFGDSKVVDENGMPVVNYSGHSNTPLYKNFEPKKATSGGFYASENSNIASNYSLSKFGGKETYEGGSQYRFKGKNGEYNKKLWQVELTEDQKKKIDKLKNAKDKYDNPIYQGLSNMEHYIKEYANYEPDVRRWKYRGGIYNLQNIWEFNEQMGYNIAYPNQKTEAQEPYFMLQTLGETEEIFNELGMDWQSYDWNQPGVFPIYLNITNPLDADKPFPQDLLKALKDAAKFERTRTDQEISWDTWTKNYPLKEWIKDIESERESWTTQIPKKALPILKSFGYDGIKERGNKAAAGFMARDERDINWIAFESGQIKSAIGNKGQFDTSQADMLRQAKNTNKLPMDVDDIASKGTDVLGRNIPDWRDATVYHSTDTVGLKDISDKGYRFLNDEENDQFGYYGRAISFTPSLAYTRQFGEHTTKATISNDVKILNLNDEKDWNIFIGLVKGKQIDEYNKIILGAGYDGVYDAGAGDLFIYNPKKIKFSGTVDNNSLKQELDMFGGRTELQQLQDRKRQLQLAIDEMQKKIDSGKVVDKRKLNDILSDPNLSERQIAEKVENTFGMPIKYAKDSSNTWDNILEAKKELRSINKKLEKNNQQDMFAQVEDDKQQSLFKAHENTRTVFSKMSERERAKFLKILANGFLDENPDIGFTNLSKEKAAAVTYLIEKAVRVDPRTADIRTAIHEANHMAMISLLPEWKARGILRENGWNGKGDYRNVNDNKTLRNAYENLAEANENWFTDTKEETPLEEYSKDIKTWSKTTKRNSKILTEKFIKAMKNLWNKLAAYLHNMGFYTQAGFFENLYTGRLRAMSVNEQTQRINELTAEQALTQKKSITETENFKKWFGNSKVVDENGEPLVVYHGTVASFNAFDTGIEGGIFFSPHPEIAELYAHGINKDGVVDYKNFGDSPNLMPVYLSLKNPFIKDFEGYESYDYYDEIEEAKLKGHDGVIAKNVIDISNGDPKHDTQTQYIVFSPTQIKSATGNNGDFNPNNPSILGQSFSPIWYSKLEKVIQEKAPGKNLSYPSLTAMLKNNGVKDDEIKWMDIEGFLKDNPKATKQELIDYLKANEIEIKEIEKNENYDKAKLNSLRKDLRDYERLTEISYNEGLTRLEINRLDELAEQHGSLDKLSELIFDIERDVMAGGDVKYSGYVTPGGTNYREILFTLPVKNRYIVKNEGKLFRVWDNQGQKFTEGDWSKFISEFDAKQQAQKLNGGNNSFKSSHWDEPNVFAHTRINDREVNGKKYLHIEEVQSDWQREGRKKGYKNEDRLNELNTKILSIDKQINHYEERIARNERLIVQGGSNPSADNTRQIRALREEILGMAKERNKLYDEIAPLKDERNILKNAVPDFPFKNNWQEFVMKRMLRYAAQNGYDGISWVTGEQTADRYDLSKKVKSVEYYTYNGRLIIHGFDKLYLIDESNVPQDKISDYIGKEAANKLLNNIDEERATERKYKLEGDGLKIGGAWATNLYDKQLPNFMDKYAKKWGGKIGEIELETNTGYSKDEVTGLSEPYKINSKAHSIDITDDMRRAVLFEGQALFQRLPNQEQSDMFDKPTTKNYLDRIAKINNWFELNNWKEKHYDDIMDLPSWERDEVIDAWKEQGRVIKENYKPKPKDESGKQQSSMQFNNQPLWEKSHEGKKVENKYEESKTPYMKYQVEANEVWESGKNKYVDFREGMKEKGIKLNPTEAIQLYNAIRKKKLTEAKNNTDQTTMIKPEPDIYNKEAERIQKKINEIIYAFKIPETQKNKVEEILGSILNEYKGKTVSDFFRVFQEKYGHLVKMYGKAGGELANRVAEANVKENRVIENFYDKYLNKLIDAYKVIEKENFHLDRKNEIDDKVTNAMEDRENAESILGDDTQAKEIYNLWKGFYDEARTELIKEGYPTLEDYFPHKKFIDDIANFMSEIPDELTSDTQGLNQFISANSPHLKRRTGDMQDIRRDMLGVGRSYVRSLARALAYKEAVNYYYSDFKKDIPKAKQSITLKPAVDFMRANVSPDKINTKWISKARNNMYFNQLGFNWKATAQNWFQKWQADLYITPETKNLVSKFMFSNGRKMVGNLEKAFLEVRQEEPNITRSKIAEDDTVQKSGLREKVEKFDPFQLAEKSNWQYAELAGIVDFVVNTKEYKELKKTKNKWDAINEVLGDKDIFRQAVRKGRDLAANTQISPAAAYRPSLFDNAWLRTTVLMYKRFPIAQLQHIANTLSSLEGSDGLRAQRILRRGLSEEANTVEVLSAIETYRKALEKLVKDQKPNWKNKAARKEIVNNKVINEWIQQIKKAETELNKRIKEAEPLKGNRAKMLGSWMKIGTTSFMLSTAFQMLYNILESAIYGDDDDDKKKLANWDNLTDKEKENLIQAIGLKSLFDSQPLPIYGFNPAKFMQSALTPDIEIMMFGNLNLRGAIKTASMFGMNVLPGLGMANRISGNKISEKITDTLAPKKEKEKKAGSYKSPYQMPKINLEMPKIRY